MERKLSSDTLMLRGQSAPQRKSTHVLSGAIAESISRASMGRSVSVLRGLGFEYLLICCQRPPQQGRKGYLCVLCQGQAGAASDGQGYQHCLGAHMPGTNHRSSSKSNK